jgi:gamma-glutamyltranspeptidase/glutathione hydrolase
VISDWHDFHMPLAAAVGAPRVHHQLLPPNTLFEEPYATLDPTVRAALEQRGYVLVNQGWNGDIEAVASDASGMVAVSDPRGRGRARVLGAAAH